MAEDRPKGCCRRGDDGDTGSAKKHPCPDCTFCQWCGDDRCNLCLGIRGKGKKLSMQEQIALYDALNRDAEPERND